MEHDEWAARVKDAVSISAESPDQAVSRLLALTDEVEALLPGSLSEWHLSQTLSIAASIIEDDEPAEALAAVDRQVVLLRQRLRGLADHLSSAASHRALLLFQLDRETEAEESVAEALRAAALAPNPNPALEHALAKLRERHGERGPGVRE